MANRPFIDTQEPTWTDVGVDSHSNVVVKDGTIDLDLIMFIMESNIVDKNGKMHIIHS